MDKNELLQMLEKEKLTKKDIERILSIKGDELLLIHYQKADETRKRYVGDEVHIRGIIEFSNYCKNNCGYCGIRRGSQKVRRYRIAPKQIIEIAENAHKTLRYESVVLQSGEDDYYNADILCDIIKAIKEKTGMAVVISIGERPLEEYRKFKAAGADRSLVRFETSNKSLYEKIHPETSLTKKSWDERISLISELKRMGYQIGSGPMIGIPGQTIEDMAFDVFLFDKLRINMAAMGPYICHPDTPMKGSPDGTVEMTLKMIAVTRIVCKDIFIPATTALQTLDKAQGRQKALMAGANILMPNITPQKYRPHYLLYPNKVCIDEKPEDCRACVLGIIRSLGRTSAKGPGHPYRRSLGEDQC